MGRAVRYLLDTTEIVDYTIRLRKATKIKVPDAIIAATAITMGAVLVTRNEDDFKCVENLKISNPWYPER